MRMLRDVEILTCFKAALLFFNLSHAPPALAISDELCAGAHGCYLPSVVVVQPQASCAVVAHELAHHRQYFRWGIAKTEEEYYWREIDAKTRELNFLDWYESTD